MPAPQNRPPYEPLTGIDDIYCICRSFLSNPVQSLVRLGSFISNKFVGVKGYIFSFRNIEVVKIFKNLYHPKTVSCLIFLFIFWFFPLYLLDKLDPFGLSR